MFQLLLHLFAGALEVVAHQPQVPINALIDVDVDASELGAPDIDEQLFNLAITQDFLHSEQGWGVGA